MPSWRAAAIYQNWGGDIGKVKCPRCGQTLMRADYAKVEIKCPRCKEIVKIEISKDRANSRTKE